MPDNYPVCTCTCTFFLRGALALVAGATIVQVYIWAKRISQGQYFDFPSQQFGVLLSLRM
jgi:hypothetical protein